MSVQGRSCQKHMTNARSTLQKQIAMMIKGVREFMNRVYPV